MEELIILGKLSSYESAVYVHSDLTKHSNPRLMIVRFY